MVYTNPNIELPGKKELKEKNNVLATTSKEYRELETTYFVFLDVLGFKQNFSNSNKNKSIKAVFEYFNFLMDQMRCLKEDSMNCYAGQTSDSLYFYTTKLNYLTCFINIFLHFNLYAMSKNVFFRGGVAKGKLHVNEPHQFYGDCVINSYLLEDEIAQYPRVAIDDKTMEDLKKVDNQWRFENNSRRNFLIPFSSVAFEDISPFLDVTNAVYKKLDLDSLKRVRRTILENQKNSEFNDKIHQKYSYLIEKCEEIISELKDKK